MKLYSPINKTNICLVFLTYLLGSASSAKNGGNSTPPKNTATPLAALMPAKKNLNKVFYTYAATYPPLIWK